MPQAKRRKIIHLDCDCFFAAVEMRDKPHLRHLPIAVGGSAAKRGVLATCNYEARKFGLHSAMSTAQAFKLCPQLVLLPHRFAAYRAASQQVLAILHEYSEQVEPLSLDEAYIDVSHVASASLLAQEIRQRIAQEVGITASAGISVNKFLAKVASDWQKPDGQFVIAPQDIHAFVACLPVKKIPGVGKVTLQKMQRMHISTCADLQALPLFQLVEIFGALGERLYHFSRGEDFRDVCSERKRKSVSVEQTFDHDLRYGWQVQQAMQTLFLQLEVRWQKLQKHYSINKIGVKLRFSDFSIVTMEQKSTAIIKEVYQQLLERVMQEKTLSVRLLGLSIGIEERNQQQMEMFI